MLIKIVLLPIKKQLELAKPTTPHANGKPSKAGFSHSHFLPMGLCDRHCVILQTNRARCTLSKDLLDLLNEDSVSGVC